MIQASDPSMTKCHESDYIIPGDFLKGFCHLSTHWHCPFCSEFCTVSLLDLYFGYRQLLVHSLHRCEEYLVWEEQVLYRQNSLRLCCGVKEEPNLFKQPSSTGEHIVLLLTRKYFQCTWFRFLFINWKECGAIKGIFKKSIHSILYITHKIKWIYLRFAFQQHIYWSGLFCKIVRNGHLSFFNFFFILVPYSPTVRIKSA